MSRVAKLPVLLPDGVEVVLNGQQIIVKGNRGELSLLLHRAVTVHLQDNKLNFTQSASAGSEGSMQAGTARSLVASMVLGVTAGFTKKLQLVGVGYRAQVSGQTVNMSLGYSHQIEHMLPPGINAECATPTEIVIKGIDKQLVGQVAADLRSYRPPEPYKGKGVRYADEIVRLKEAKTK